MACSVCCHIMAATSPDCITVLFRLYGGEIASGLRRWLAGKTINNQLLIIKQKRQCYRRSIYYYKRTGSGSRARTCGLRVVHVALPPCSPAYSSRRRSPIGQRLSYLAPMSFRVRVSIRALPLSPQNHLLGRWAGHGSLARRLTSQAVGYFGLFQEVKDPFGVSASGPMLY